MPQTKITTNAVKIERKIKKIQKLYRKRMLRALAQNIDEIRTRVWKKYILPKSKIRGKTDPSKLTSRTDTLVNIFRSGKTWDIKTKTGKLLNKSRYLRTRIKILKEQPEVIYQGTLHVPYPSGKDKAPIKQRLLHEERGHFKTRQRRPFFFPAVNEQKTNMKKIIRERAEAIRNVNL